MHASLTEEIHRLGSEGLAEAFASVARERSRWAKITPSGLKIVVVLSIGPGYDRRHKLPPTVCDLDPIGAEIRILCVPSG